MTTPTEELSVLNTIISILKILPNFVRSKHKSVQYPLEPLFESYKNLTECLKTSPEHYVEVLEELNSLNQLIIEIMNNTSL